MGLGVSKSAILSIFITLLSDNCYSFGGNSTIEHQKFMTIALEEAKKGKDKGNAAIGSVIVCDNQVIGKGHNIVTTDGDITMHAEIAALRNASLVSGVSDFTGCILYTTMEPCMMCVGAIVVSGVTTLVMGGNYASSTGSYGDYQVNKAFLLVERNNITVIRGVMVEECEDIVRF